MEKQIKALDTVFSKNGFCKHYKISDAQFQEISEFSYEDTVDKMHYFSYSEKEDFFRVVNNSLSYSDSKGIVIHEADILCSDWHWGGEHKNHDPESGSYKIEKSIRFVFYDFDGFVKFASMNEIAKKELENAFGKEQANVLLKKIESEQELHFSDESDTIDIFDDVAVKKLLEKHG